METIDLTVALNDYDHVRDLTSGVVRAQGISLIPLQYRPHQIFHRFMTNREWEVSEMSLGGFCGQIASGDAGMIGLPVFPSRVFRQSALYVRGDGSITEPGQLKGRRCGIPEWGQTAGIYVRGWLMHQVGLKLQDIEWVQGGINQPGRIEHIDLDLPEGVRLNSVQDRSLADLLIAEEIDCIIAAAPPDPFRAGDPRIARLFPDCREVEEAYFRETGIYPIMHTLAIRGDVYEKHKWIAMNLMLAFEEARDRSVERIMATGSHIAHPWGYEDARRLAKLFFGDGE